MNIGKIKLYINKKHLFSGTLEFKDGMINEFTAIHRMKSKYLRYFKNLFNNDKVIELFAIDNKLYLMI